LSWSFDALVQLAGAAVHDDGEHRPGLLVREGEIGSGDATGSVLGGAAAGQVGEEVADRAPSTLLTRPSARRAKRVGLGSGM